LAARGFPWRLGPRVGEGASAVVHRADGGGRAVALKVARRVEMNAPLAGEAALLAHLERRWGPSLEDAGRIPAGLGDLPEGARYIATSWVDGRSLDAVLDEGPHDRGALATIVAHAVARALDELHVFGVRHGDVKPANILVHGEAPREDRASERGATLIDMGLAADVTGDAAAGGTPRYLAPELRRGEAAGPAADLFALGVVLLEILDPDVRGAADPVAVLAAPADTRAAAEHPVARLAAALTAPAPGARPSAAWVAERAARVLRLPASAEEVHAARIAQIRRAYLAVRRDDIAPRAVIDARIDGRARAWLEEALRWTERLSTTAASPARTITPLDPLGIARWLVALVGADAATWPTGGLRDVGDGALAARMEALAATLAPEAWTLRDLAGDPSEAVPLGDVGDGPEGAERWVAMTRALLAPRPRETALAGAEDAVVRGLAPPSVAFDLASALLRRGDVGRAHAALASIVSTRPGIMLLRADVARRRGESERAEELARGVAEDVTAPERDDARALLARLAWDRGHVDAADGLLGSARGAMAAEVRGLVAYARGEIARGIAAVDLAINEAEAPLAQARLFGTRGMLEHARGASQDSLAAFARASELAARAGADVEEATYLTGLAAAAVDAGEIGRALASATRAALLWERLARPELAARALLGRAAAFALACAMHEADEASRIARGRAAASGDARAAAFARWAVVETRPRGDVRAREEALLADAELGATATDDDRIRSAARLLLWADGARDGRVDVPAIDARVASRAAATRWEWWGARAASSSEPRVLAEIVALLDVPAPLASRGPALAAAARLASELGDGDVARRLETARRAAADRLREGCPPEHRASLSGVLWASTSALDGRAAFASASALGAAQVEQLDAIVRSLASRDRLKPLLEQVLDTMVLWTGVERGLLLLRAPDGKLVPRVARNLARRDLHGEQLSLSMSLAKRAMDQRETVCATDAFAQVGDLHASVHALRLRSVLAVPLVARGDVLGVVYLDDRVRRGAFGESELAWVRLVASQAALAVADARDQALLRRAVRRAERANERLARELGAREAELATMRAGLATGEETRFRYDEIAGRSEPMRAMLRLVDRVTASDVPVLLVGESGTGKELVARAIHANGARARKPFVGENCASVPETLLESTLFGHVRGAFTGASGTRAGLFDVADGGTLFLDEIGEMSLGMQTKLLRVLQNGEIRPVGGERERKVDVRIIGATHRDLEAMVAAGTFREDLFYRLNVVTLRVPPLRERAADIPLLVSHLLEKHAGGKRLKVTRAALDRLVAYPWPGNVRQLENELRRAIVLADDRIDVGELSEDVARGGPGTAREAGLGLKARVDALEAQLVKEALVRTKGNQTRAAEVLGISRFGLQKMMRRLGIKPS